MSAEEGDSRSRGLASGGTFNGCGEAGVSSEVNSSTMAGMSCPPMPRQTPAAGSQSAATGNRYRSATSVSTRRADRGDSTTVRGTLPPTRW